MEQYNVTGMSCAACSARVEKAVSKVEGVKSCSVSLLTNSMGVEGTAGDEAIIAAVEAAGSIDGPTVQKAMLELSGIKGLGGTFDFAAGEGSGEGLFDFTSWVMVDGAPMELGAWKQTDDYKAMAEKMGW